MAEVAGNRGDDSSWASLGETQKEAHDTPMLPFCYYQACAICGQRRAGLHGPGALVCWECIGRLSKEIRAT